MPEDMGGGFCGCDYPPALANQLVYISSTASNSKLDLFLYKLPHNSTFDCWLWWVMVMNEIPKLEECV